MDNPLEARRVRVRPKLSRTTEFILFFVRFWSFRPELSKNVHFASLYTTGNPHKLRDCCNVSIQEEIYGDIESAPIIVIKWDEFNKIKIDIFLPEMLCIVVLAAENGELCIAVWRVLQSSMEERQGRKRGVPALDHSSAQLRADFHFITMIWTFSIFPYVSFEFKH